MDVVDLEDPIQQPYYGPKNMKPLIAYILFRNLNVGDFVLVRSHDFNLVHVWIGKAQCDIVKDKKSENFKMVKVQRWVPMKKGSNLDE